MKRKNAEFKSQLVDEEIQKMRAKRLGPMRNQGTANVARKQSVLLGELLLLLFVVESLMPL